MKRETIGILGGMGPLATADFFQKIVTNTQATCDQEHIPVLMQSDPTLPCRQKAIMGTGPSPVAHMVKGVELLQAMGATVLTMPCTTAHHFYPQLTPHCKVPFLHMPQETVNLLGEVGVSRVCLLATSMTIQTEVYDGLFTAKGIHMVVPSFEAQAQLTDGIFKGVKQGSTDVDCSLLIQELTRMHTHMGVELFVMACTELPTLFAQQHIELPTIDASVVLARAAIRVAGGTPVSHVNPIYR